ncbi:MAG: phosphoribosylanthranilate isomerase [Bacteroidetes bacterium]|nr:MAG: phosphoribosylanthranilate isomerase [Bacteroidota bacterium]
MIIKTCGLRAPENIAALAKLPIDWFGFICYPQSSRYIGPEATALRQYLADQPVPQQRVGVFVNASIDEIRAAVAHLNLNLLQLHGEESPAFCAAVRAALSVGGGEPLPLIKAFRVGPDFDFQLTAAYAPYCSYFLFDTKGETHGGTGQKFDWSVLRQYVGDTPFLLSGGIGPTDAAAVKAFQHPRLIGIDVNSKFERAPGLKDAQKLNEFLTAIITSS